MNEFNAALVMISLFALRCIVPLALTLALGYLMNRLVDHWQAEDAAQTAALPAARPALATAPGRAILSLPCWVTNSCPEQQAQRCAARRATNVPCWETRRQADGRLPACCADCPRYQAAFAIAM